MTVSISADASCHAPHPRLALEYIEALVHALPACRTLYMSMCVFVCQALDSAHLPTVSLLMSCFRLLRRVAEVLGQWPIGFWRRPKRWPVKTLRLKDQTPGKSCTIMHMLLCVEHHHIAKTMHLYNTSDWAPVLYSCKAGWPASVTTTCTLIWVAQAMQHICCYTLVHWQIPVASVSGSLNGADAERHAYETKA